MDPVAKSTIGKHGYGSVEACPKCPWNGEAEPREIKSVRVTHGLSPDGESGESKSFFVLECGHVIDAEIAGNPWTVGWRVEQPEPRRKEAVEATRKKKN